MKPFQTLGMTKMFLEQFLVLIRAMTLILLNLTRSQFYELCTSTLFHHKNTVYPIKSSSHTRIINEAPGTHTLYIPSCDNFDFGTYTCRVTNKYGMVESSCSVCEYIVGVTDSPTLSGIRAGRKVADGSVNPRFTREPNEITVLRVGDELVVCCEVEGWPQVAVNLYRGCRNVTLQHGAYKELNPPVASSATDSRQVVKFTLSSIGITDFGMYTVEAKNIVGVAKAFVNVKPLDTHGALTTSCSSLGKDVPNLKSKHYKIVRGNPCFDFFF